MALPKCFKEHRAAIMWGFLYLAFITATIGLTVLITYFAMTDADPDAKTDINGHKFITETIADQAAENALNSGLISGGIGLAMFGSRFFYKKCKERCSSESEDESFTTRLIPKGKEDGRKLENTFLFGCLLTLAMIYTMLVMLGVSVTQLHGGGGVWGIFVASVIFLVTAFLAFDTDPSTSKRTEADFTADGASGSTPSAGGFGDSNVADGDQPEPITPKNGHPTENARDPEILEYSIINDIVGESSSSSPDQQCAADDNRDEKSDPDRWAGLDFGDDDEIKHDILLQKMKKLQDKAKANVRRFFEGANGDFELQPQSTYEVPAPSTSGFRGSGTDTCSNSSAASTRSEGSGWGSLGENDPRMYKRSPTRARAQYFPGGQTEAAQYEADEKILTRQDEFRQQHFLGGDNNPGTGMPDKGHMYEAVGSDTSDSDIPCYMYGDGGSESSDSEKRPILRRRLLQSPKQVVQKREILKTQPNKLLLAK